MEHRVKLLWLGGSSAQVTHHAQGVQVSTWKKTLKAVFRRNSLIHTGLQVLPALQFLLELRGLTVMHGVLNPGPSGEAGTNEGEG